MGEHYVPGYQIAVSIIDKHFCLLKQEKEAKVIEHPDKEFENLVMIDRRIHAQKEVLQKVIAELSSLKLKETRRVLTFVSELLIELVQKRPLIFQTEELLYLGISMFSRHLIVLESKSEIIHQIDVLERILKEISLVQFPLTSGLTSFRGVAEYYQFPPLLRQVRNLGLLDLIGESVGNEKSIRNLKFRPSISENDTRLVTDSINPEQHRQTYPFGSYFRKFWTIIAKNKTRPRNEKFSRNRNIRPIALGFAGSLPGSSDTVEFVVADSVKPEQHKKTESVVVDSVNPEQHKQTYPFGSYFRKLWSIIAKKKSKRNDPVKSEQSKKRYLCLGNGFEVFCLDLKQSQDQSFSLAEDTPALPKIGTLELFKECPAVSSVGLFSWNSKAYMICGKVPKSLVDGLHSRSTDFRSRRMQKWGIFFEKLYEGGSSCIIKLFSLAEDGTSSQSESGMAKLNKPKFWPVLEKIAGKMHLIDSLPSKMSLCDLAWTFSHEILNPDSNTWTEISLPNKDVLRIDSYLVVGDRIFAESPMGYYGETYSEASYFVFNKSNTMEWELFERKMHHSSQKDVWDILKAGSAARCAGKFKYGRFDSLYVIVSVERDASRYEMGTKVLAYLVTKRGKVVCYQMLRGFFTGPVWPCDIEVAKLIDVGDDGGMCSIVIATAWEHSDVVFHRDYVFVNTFRLHSHAASQVEKVLERGGNAWPVVQDFVRLDVIDSCAYKKLADETQELDDLSSWMGLQACFL